MSSRRIYFDNAATTRPLPAVVEAMARAQLELFGNPSSAHSFGPPARKALDDAREFLRGTLGAARVVLTSGGSEADLLGIVGAAAARSPGRVLMASTDHPAILECEPLLRRFRMQATALPVTRSGDVDPEILFDALGQDVRVVAILFGHNELGTLCDLEELVSLVRRTAPDAHVHVDLVQSYAKIPFDLDQADVDSVAVSAHKFHGPRGAGFLALSSKARILPLQKAGGQEGGLRGGTENVAGAIGMQVAAEHALCRLADTSARTRSLCDHIARELRAEFPEVEVLGHATRKLPHVLSLRIPGVVGETLMLRCDAEGLAFSVGSACHGASGDHADNPVLRAIGLDRRKAREVIRLSFCGENTIEEADRALDILCEQIDELRRVAPKGG
ncbi:MAG: cysteine desulfurase family protein [Planctomycetota bacterium]